MNLLFVTPEALPFAKSGGLGDVMGALPKELRRMGADARIILPLYKNIKEQYFADMEEVDAFSICVSWREKYCGVHRLEYEQAIYYFVDNEEYFCRDQYYGFYDDGERFAYFNRAVMEILPVLSEKEGWKPEILHCSEWQTALVPVYLKTLYRDAPGYEDLRTVFTIHNIEYQGQYDPAILTDIFGIDKRDYGIVEHSGCINLVKGAIVTCDKLTTVSPSYAEEIQYGFYARGLDKTIKENAYKLRGILNGIDTTLFNPWFDKNIKTRYSPKRPEKKADNKLALQEELGLMPAAEPPLIAMVTRLVSHKGIDLLTSVFDELMGENIQLVILGSGDRPYVDFINGKAAAYPGKLAVYIGFDPGLASRIYAGADMFLMPSISEPCGLAQMISAKYGTIPIVRATGGLKDSIEPYNSEEKTGNGVTFGQINAQDMLGAIKRAIALYWQKDEWSVLMGNAFASDFSWKRGAEEYMQLYRELN